MNTMLDIIFSSFVGGMLMLAIFGVGNNLAEVSYKNNFDYSVQLAVTDLSQMIEYDFNKIGFRVASSKITAADSMDFTFRSDITNTHTTTTIRYYAGTTSGLSNTPNPNDFLLYKSVNGGTPTRINFGLTKLRFAYYDSTGAPIARPVTSGNLPKIHGIKVLALVEAPAAFDSVYSKQYWERTFFPKNL